MSATVRPALRGLTGRVSLMAHIHNSGLAPWAELERWTDDELRHVARAVAAVEDALVAVRSRHAGPPAAHA